MPEPLGDDPRMLAGPGCQHAYECRERGTEYGERRAELDAVACGLLAIELA